MRSADWVRLTNRLAEGAKPSSREQFLRDGELKGFGLRVAPSGLKTFFLEFRSPVDRRFRRLRLGRYPDLSVDAARTLAKKAKGDTYAQRDPAAERVQLRQRASCEMALETSCERFISEYAERHRRSWKRDKAPLRFGGGRVQGPMEEEDFGDHPGRSGSAAQQNHPFQRSSHRQSNS
jgi:hypothetical protein